MSELQKKGQDQEAELSMIRFLAVVLRRWRFILGVAAGTAVIAATVYALRSPVYSARALLFENKSETSSMPSSGGGQSPLSMMGMLSGARPNSDLIGMILTSRSLADSVAGRVGVVPRTSVMQGDDGSITIEVMHSDPQIAARIANTYPEVINSLIGRLSLDATGRKQEFLRQQIEVARARLEEAERKMVSFQRENDVPEIKEQLVATITSAMELEQRIREHELQVSLLRRTATPANTDYRAAVAQLEMLRRQRARMQSERTGESLLPSLKESPGLQANATRLLREYAEAEQFYTALAVSLVSSQISASENLPAVGVLDPATVPTRPISPGVGVIMGIGLLLGLIVGSLAVLLSEVIQNARRNPKYAPLIEALDGIKAEITRSSPFSRARAARPSGNLGD